MVTNGRLVIHVFILQKALVSYTRDYIFTFHCCECYFFHTICKTKVSHKLEHAWWLV